jgi:ABC-type multidrug transport system fused ATPase/permease subunit
MTLRLLRLAAGVRGRLAGCAGLGLAVTATYVAQGLLVARVIAELLQGERFGAVVPALLAVAVLLGLRALLLWLRDVVAADAAGAVKRVVRRRLYAKLLQLGPGHLLQERTGSVQATLVDGVEYLDRYYGAFLPQMVATAIGVLAIGALLTAIDPLVGGATLAVALAVAFAPLLSRRIQRLVNKRYMQTLKSLGADYLDAVQGMSTLKAFDASRTRGAELHGRARAFYKASISVVAVGNLQVGAMALLSSAGTAVAVGVGVLRLTAGAVTVAELLVILLLSREAFRPLTELQKAYHAAYQAFPAATGIFQLLDTPPEVADPPAPRPATGGPVVFDHVTFSYRPGDRPAVADLSFTLHPGETVALVGRSGAGKTTAAALLLRFFDPQDGRVTIGGRDLRELTLAELRAQIAVVAQDTYLFHGTVRDNLLLGKADATQEELEAAARAAGAHRFVAALPRGYDTVIGERGLKLSGGERQRVAIARALLKDAPILVLDEATSSVDAANEAAIQQALGRLAATRTTLVIAHRLSTVRDADRIVVLDAGHPVEAGDHGRLLAARGAYARLVAAQEATG